MPCDTIQTTGVELANPHLDSLMKALEHFGLNPRQEVRSDGKTVIRFRGGSFQDGQLRIASNSVEASDIRARYATEIGSYAAKQFGFKMQEAQTKTRGAIAAFKLVKNVR